MAFGFLKRLEGEGGQFEFKEQERAGGRERVERTVQPVFVIGDQQRLLLLFCVERERRRGSGHRVFVSLPAGSDQRHLGHGDRASAEMCNPCPGALRQVPQRR